MLSLDWVSEHWFDLLQSAGIMGGLLFSGFALRRDSRERKVQNLFTLTKQHREIWSELYERPELARVLEKDPDLKSKPVTREEDLFVRFIILHLKDGFRAAKAGFYAQPEGLAEDIRTFFSLPIPRGIWKNNSSIQDTDFVTFIEKMCIPMSDSCLPSNK